MIKRNIFSLLPDISCLHCRHSLTKSRKLDPILSDAEMFDLIKSSTDCLYPLPPEGETGGKKGKTETEDSKLEAEVLLEATFESLHDLLKELLKKDCTPAAYDNIFKVL